MRERIREVAWMEEGWESDGAVIDGDEKSNKVEGRAFLLRFTPF